MNVKRINKTLTNLPVPNFQHPLFDIVPPEIVVSLSFTQLALVEADCEKYRQAVEVACGAPFSITAWKKHQHDHQIKLRQMVVARLQHNHEKWQSEQKEKVLKWQEQRERDRLQLLEQMEEINERKLQKRREELEADEKYLQDCEKHELKLLERENEQRRKNIEYYTELASIVDAQQKRADDEIAELKAQLAAKRSENVPIADESDNDSVYFDAEKNSSFHSPEEKILPIPRSISDILNANDEVTTTEDLGVDRARNRANVLSSNINLATFDNDNATQQVIVPSTELTEAQKIKMKVMQQEFAWFDANANTADDGKLATTQIPTELTELQRNRQKVLASEFGLSNAVVNLAVALNTNDSSEFGVNKKSAQSHSHTFNQMGDVNANKPMSELQRNREKVLTQEYSLDTVKSGESARNKLKASLSLELDNSTAHRAKELSVKPCQSEVNLSPMSTSSDPIADQGDGDASGKGVGHVEDSGVEVDGADAEQSKDKSHGAEGIEESPDGNPSLNGQNQETLSKDAANGVETPFAGLPFFLQTLRPSFTSSNIFDISPQLSLPPPTPTVDHQSLKTLTESDIQNLNSANLTHFLQQSFAVPFRTHFTILNNAILKIFYEELDIMSHFNSLRNYFFMMDGEFACNISDGLISKLHSVRKPSELLNSHALHSILENALQSTLMGNDENAVNLSFCIPNVPEQFDLASPNVLAELHMSYKIDWPLNLVISEDAVKQYDVVFQYLLKLRRITWLLEQCFYVSIFIVFGREDECFGLEM